MKWVTILFLLMLLQVRLSQQDPAPTGQPSRQPTDQPSRQPSRQPTGQPSRQPSRQPTGQPSRQPTRQPTGQPTRKPTGQPSRQPSGQPIGRPTGRPTRQPTTRPSASPTHRACFICQSGQYYNTNLTHNNEGVVVGCTDCRPGYTCAGGCKFPVACPVGKYSPEFGSRSCLTCPSGMYNRLKGSSSCLYCDMNYYCTNSTSLPVPCPQGYFSTTGSSACTRCPGGTYNSGPGTSCTSCVAGQFCTAGSALPAQCPLGTYSLGGASNCTWCPPGFYCDKTTIISPKPCSAGSYSLGGVSSCTLNPPGYEITSASEPPEICPAGKYSSGGTMTTCQIASAGRYSPTPGRADEVVCSQGYYSSAGATVCTQCDPGWLCPAGSTSATPANSMCPQGYFCPSSTDRQRCPAGRYGANTGSAPHTTLDEGCIVCEAGYFCSGVTGTSGDKTSCPSGAYCAAGSAQPTLCPQGTYSPANRQNQISIATCVVCEESFYCGPAGSTSHYPCPRNFFCPVATGDYNESPCPPGTYGATTALYSASQCSNCTVGHYCAGGADPLPCPAGSYNEYLGGSTIFSCALCPSGYACPSTGMWNLTSAFICLAGHYCPLGTQSLTQFPCPAGTYGDATGLRSVSSCINCPAGMMCKSGSSSKDQVKCPAGYYCPESTSYGQPQPCPEGTHSTATGRKTLSDCLACPAGSYCLAAARNVTGPCSAGYFCPEGSTSPTGNACPAGTYSTLTSLKASGECLPTTAGYYSNAGSSVMIPCPSGRYSSVTNTKAAGGDGSVTPYCLECTAGYFCPAASSARTKCGRGFYSAAVASACTICPLGTYCSSNTTSSTMLTTGGGSWSKATDLSGVCFPGTLCDRGVKVIPSLNTNACPAGSYCPEGTQGALSCPPGTINPFSGKGYVQNCTTTPSGYYSKAGSSAAAGMCHPGYYCLAGSTVPNQTPCPAGRYNADYAGESMSKCSKCPAGFYCPIASSTPLMCPRGYYCPESTSDPPPCLPGSYGNSPGLRTSSDCTPCDGGMYCDGFGLQNPRGSCSPGFFCVSSSNSSTPLDSNTTHAAALVMGTNTFFGRCPRGAYCGMGTKIPILCPEGTYTGHEGGKSRADCTACPGGHYCQGLGNIAPTGLCSAGYFCPGGASTAQQNLTQPGYFSLSGAPSQTECSPGFYNGLLGQSACTPCLKGFYCPRPAMTTYADNPCPPGSFCVSNAISPTLCPNGTYSYALGLTKEAECTLCTPGSYCSGVGLTAVSEDCYPKFYCLAGSSTPEQKRCTVGHYCPAATGSPLPCPAGTFMNSLSNGGSIVVGSLTFECTPCLAGQACTVSGLTAPNARCGGGYWCASAATAVNASCTTSSYCSVQQGSSLYDICPPGSRCPPGSSSPIPCEAGTYQSQHGMPTCTICPAGAVCPLGSSSYSVCPASRFCLAGSSTGTYCPDATYSTVTGLERSSQCLSCPGGQYCKDGNIVGQCAAGHFCRAGQSIATPTVDDSAYAYSALIDVAFIMSQTGGQCPAGHYCPTGSTVPTPCKNGTHNADQFKTSQSGCGPCPQGATCLTSSPVAEYCAAGRYCPTDSLPIDCPKGTYNQYVGMGFLANCTACPAGYYCDAQGISNYTSYRCSPGKYCLEGTGKAGRLPINCPEGTYRETPGARSSSDCSNCTAIKHRIAHYCPAGSVVPVVCPSGFYCWSTGQGFSCPPGGYCPFNSTAPTPCPENFYCPGGTTAPLPCVQGTYCPASSSSPKSCPLGYKGIVGADGTINHLHSLLTACEKCPIGTYGTDPQRLVCSPGTPGYVFPTIGATTSKPINATNGGGYICPEGHYCPKGSILETPCPVGTYNPSKGKANFTDCLSCDVGYYQYLTGSPSCLKCSASSASTERSSVCTCVGLNRAFQPKDGMCICKPGYEFVDANLVVSSDKDGSYDCQPQVYARCSGDTVRDSNGKCVDSSTYCNKFCAQAGGSGTINTVTGTCDCKVVPTVADICDSTCRASKPVITCVDGLISEYDPVTGVTTTTNPNALVTDGVGSISCSSGSKVVAMSTASGSFAGVFGAPPALARRRLQADQNTRLLTSDPSIANPIVCLGEGDSIVFGVSNENYPSYQKDSLLNTNPNFDYSAFRSLAAQAASTKTISTFPFTFTAAGTYVFTLGSSSSLTIITVLPAGVACSTESGSVFAELSATNLAKLGVQSKTSFVVTPQWDLLIGVLVGLLALAIFVSGFLYYFRKRAWDWHSPVEAKYRDKNRELGAPKETKGGLWSQGQPMFPSWGGKGDDEDLGDGRRRKPKPKTGKKLAWWEACFGRSSVGVDGDKVKYDDDDLKIQDIDEAVAAKNLAETEFQDDMLIPELAKHMQAQHDKIDRQLGAQREMMNKLKNVFRHEVDELKAMLESTTAEMSAAGGTDVARARKLRELLREARENTVKRGAFDGHLITGELAMASVGDKISKTFEGGAETVLDVVVEELSRNTSSAQERDEELRGLISPTLHTVISLVESFTSLVGSQSAKIAEERRRAQTATAAFERSLKISHVLFPDSIFSLMNLFDASLVPVDAATDDVMSIVRAFSERVPLFLSTVAKAEAALVSSLADILEQSSNTQLEKDKAERVSELRSYLSEFSEAVALVMDRLTQRRGLADEPRDQSKVVREELVTAIDDELAMLAEAAQDAMRLAAALNASGAASGQGPQMGQSSRLEGGGAVAVSSERPSSSGGAGEALDDAVINNDDLTIAQKQDMLEAADTDRQITANMIELQRKAIEEEQQKLLHGAGGLSQKQKKVEDESTLNSRDRAEQKALDDALRKSRDNKLESMMRVEYFATLPQDSAHDCRVATLAVNRYSALLRCFSIDARLQYEALLSAYQVKRAAAHAQLSNSDATSTAKINLDASALDKELEAEVAALGKRLEQELGSAIAAEDALRSNWQTNTSAINVDGEMQRLKRECEAKVAAAKAGFGKLAEAARKSSSTDADTKLRLFQLRCDEMQYSDDDRKALQGILSKELEMSSAVTEARAAESARLLTAEAAALDQILAVSDAWGPQVNQAGLQGQLFLRVVAGIHAAADVQLRLALTEHQLLSEIQQVRVENELRKRNAPKQELEINLKNLSDSSAENAAKLVSTMQAERNALIAKEQQRQQLSIVDYERERANAIEADARASVLNAIKISRSRQLMRKSFEDILAIKSETVRALEVAPTLRLISERQLNSELLREELELSASYSSFEAETLVVSTYASEMVRGASPSIEWAQKAVGSALSAETRIMLEALTNDKLHRRSTKELMSGILRDLEEKRLLALGRSPKDLEKVYADLEAQLTEQWAIVDKYVSKEKSQLQGLLQEQADEKSRAHVQYQQAVVAIAQQDAAQLEQLEQTYERSIASLKADERNEASAIKRLRAAQKFASDLANQALITHDALFSAYTDCTARLRLVHKLEDELRLRRNETQQVTEALENSNDSDAMNAYLALLEQQVVRQRAARRLKDGYELELNGLEKTMTAKGDAAKKFLKDRLEQRKAARERELTKQGLSPEAAARQAASESQMDVDSIMAAAKLEHARDKKELQEAIKRDVTEQATALKAEFKQALFASENGMAALAARENEALQARLKARRDARLKELQGPPSNKSLAIAKKIVERELKESDEGECVALEATLGRVDAGLRSNVEKLYGELEGEIRQGYAAELERVAEDPNLKAAEKQSRTNKLSAALADELAFLSKQHTHSLNIIERGLPAGQQEARAKLVQEQQQRRSGRIEEMVERDGLTEKEAAAKVEAEEKRQTADLESLLQLAARANEMASKESFEQRKLDVLFRHEAKHKGLEEAFAFKKKQGEAAIKDRLAKRKDLREKMLRAATALASADAKSLLETELQLVSSATTSDLADATSDQALEAAKKQTKDALSRAAKSLAKSDEELRRTEMDEHERFMSERRSHQTAIVKDNERKTLQTLQRIQSDALAAMNTLSENEEMKRLRQLHDEAAAKLEKRFQLEKAQAEDEVKRRLNARHAAREAELKKQGLADAVVAATIAAEDDAATHEALLKIQTQHAAEAAQLSKSTAEAEAVALDKQRELLSQEAKAKEEVNAVAARNVEDLKTAQELEFKRLLEQQRADREAHEKNLKARLAQKREAQLKALADTQASQAERAAAALQVDEEEHALMVEAERERVEADQRRLESLRKEHESALAVLQQEAERVDLEASLAASKSAMLATMQENKLRAEAEANAKEAKRLKELQEQEATRAEAEAEAAKGAQKGKLVDRLKAKRDQKESFLRQQEEAARAELLKRQQDDAAEREQFRIARAQWTATLQAASDKADAQGLVGTIREDSLLNAVLRAGPEPVPTPLYGEVVEAVLLRRHSDETTQLLARLGSDRIALLKQAAERCQAGKAKARIALIEALNDKDPPASAEEIEAETRRLDDEFSRQQLDEERRVADQQDPRELKDKIDLKERQMEEVARLVRMHAQEGGSASLSSLAAQPVKSVAEELAEYRASLEAQKEERKGAMLRQRQEEEDALRREGEVKKRVMQEQLAADLKNAEEEAEAKRKALEATLKRQKEEIDKKASEETSEEHRVEAERKKAEFEKEHAAALEQLESDKAKGKARLQDRLNKKRKGDAAASITTFAPLPSGPPSSDPSSDPLLQPASATDSASPAPAAAAAAAAAAGQGSGGPAQESVASRVAARRAGAGADTDPAVMKQLTGYMGHVQKKLDRLDKLMSSLDVDKLVASLQGAAVAKAEALGTTTAAQMSASSASASPAQYRDADEPTPGPELVPLRSEDLHVVEKSRLEYGHRLANLLGLSRLRVRAASCLPHSSAIGNAYRDSYHYVHDDNVLYVHLRRLERSGDVGVVMVHALAHIKANPLDLSQDSDPGFLAVFYKALAALSQENFKLSAGATDTVAPMLAASAKLKAVAGSQRKLPLGGGDVGSLGSIANLGASTRRMSLARASSGINTNNMLASPTSSSASAAVADALLRFGGSGDGELAEEGLLDRVAQYAKGAGAAIPQEYLDRYLGQQQQQRQRAASGSTE